MSNSKSRPQGRLSNFTALARTLSLSLPLIADATYHMVERPSSVIVWHVLAASANGAAASYAPERAILLAVLTLSFLLFHLSAYRAWWYCPIVDVAYVVAIATGRHSYCNSSGFS